LELRALVNGALSILRRYAMNTGVTCNTVSRIIKGPGVVYANYEPTTGEGTILGATRGGNEFDPGLTLRDVAVDGVLGKVKGLTWKQRVEPTLTVRLVEITSDNLTKAIAGALEDGGSITGSPIADSTYLDNVALVAENNDGTEMVYMVKNALATAVNPISHPDQNEAVLEVTFTGHFDCTDMDEEPWEIIPLVLGS